MLSTHNKEEEEDEVATRDDTRDDTREMSVLRGGGVIGAKPALTLPPIAGVRRTTNKLETRMTARPEERDRLYGIAEESDVIRTDVEEMGRTDATDVMELDATDATESDATEMDAMETTQMDVHTTPPVTSNDLRGLPPSARM